MAFLPVQNISIDDIHKAVGGASQSLASLNDSDIRAFLNPDIFYGGTFDETSVQTVFDSWVRFSHNTSGNYPASSSELASWSYDGGTGGIESTINSITYMGFVSPTTQKYDNYTLETKITTTNADNDRVAIVIAYVEENGVQYTLSAIRNQDGSQTSSLDSWCIVYNFFQSGAFIVQNGNSLIPYSGISNWNNFAQGTTIRVEREGDIVRCYSTDPGSTTLKGELTVDLSSSPTLQRFQGPQQIGFACQSQDNALFKPIFYGGDFIDTTPGSQISIGQFRNGFFVYNELLFQGTEASPITFTYADYNDATATMLIAFRFDGNIARTDINGQYPTASFYDWCVNNPPLGDYWLRATLLSGTVDIATSSPLDTWLNIEDIEPAFFWRTTGFNQTVQGVLKIEISDAADGSNIIGTSYYKGVAITA